MAISLKLAQTLRCPFAEKKCNHMDCEHWKIVFVFGDISRHPLTVPGDDSQKRPDSVLLKPGLICLIKLVFKHSQEVIRRKTFTQGFWDKKASMS